MTKTTNTGSYQQEDATTHINKLNGAPFRGNEQSDVCPAHSYGPTSSDCYLWGHLKYVS